MNVASPDKGRPRRRCRAPLSGGDQVKDPLKMLTMTLRDYFLPSQGYTVVTITHTFASGLARLRYSGRFSLTAVGAATLLIATDTERT